VTHRGVTLALILGRLVAEEIATGDEAWQLTQFRPGRFTERTTRVLRDIDEMFR
jgi:glycine/D-amino acid oxidase-like deaminating enzyme